jgi:hypothetical protein
MQRPLSRFQIAFLVGCRFSVLSSPFCLKKDLKKEIMLDSLIRKKFLLSSVFCKKRAFSANFFPRKSEYIRRMCKMLATTRFHGTPTARFGFHRTFRGRVSQNACHEAVS